MDLQKQGIEIEDAVEEFGEYVGAKAVQNIFLALAKDCKANKEGLFCKEGGVDFVGTQIKDAYKALDEAQDKEKGATVKGQVKQYFQIFHDCTKARAGEAPDTVDP